MRVHVAFTPGEAANAQLGIVVTLARDAQLPSPPLLSRLVELIHDIENGRRTQSLETLDALAATATDASSVTNALRV